MLKRTKIVATLGPSTDPVGTLERLLRAGVNVFRLNFSHGTTAEHRQRITQVREASRKTGIPVALLGDLQGPKIRIARFLNQKITLTPNDHFTLDAGMDPSAGDQQAVGIDYKQLPDDCQPGDILLLDDGRIQLKVEKIEDAKILTRVLIGGVLSNNKGINRLGGGLSVNALTDKDRFDIKFAAEIDFDYIAVSFPRSAEDFN